MPVERGCNACFERVSVNVDRQFPRAAGGGQRLPQSGAEAGHGAGGQSDPAAEQNLPANPLRQGGHKSMSSNAVLYCGGPMQAVKEETKYK